MLVKICEESEQKEFIVSKGSEFARVGRKGIIFKLSTETLLLTFASDEVVFFLSNFRKIQNMIQDSNQFCDSVMKIKEDKSNSVFRQVYRFELESYFT